MPSTGSTDNRDGVARVRSVALPWIVLLILTGFAYGAVSPPTPLPRDAPAGQFSADRAFDHVEAIATIPHPMGSAAIEQTRAYISGELEELGLRPELQRIPARDFFGDGGPVDVVNILATIPGSGRSGTIALVAHYDTHPATSGANDNTAAVAALLEAGRALISGPPPGRDVLLLFTDGEEPSPRFGSSAFIAGHPAAADLVFAVNLETNGGSGASILAETSGPRGWLIRELAAAGSGPAAFSFLTQTADLLGDIGTDFDSFRNAGITGLHFAYLHGSPIYHTEADDIDAVSRGSLQHHGNHVLDVARHFGNLDLRSGDDDDAVFFTVRDRVFLYSVPWAVPLALVALAACVAATVLSMRRSRTTGRDLARSAGRSLLIGLGTTIGATVVWIAVAAVRQTPGVLESYLYLFGLLAASVWIARQMRTRQTPLAGTTLLALGLLSLMTAATAPGYSYLFTWPALAGAAAVAAGDRSGTAAGWARFLLVAIPVVLLMTPAVDLFFQFAQPRPGNPDSELTFAVALPIMLALLAAGILGRVWPTEADPISRPAPAAEAAAQ